MATQNLFISEISFNKFIQNVVFAYFYIVNVFRILDIGIHKLLQKKKTITGVILVSMVQN